jgi:hypothetical protein
MAEPSITEIADGFENGGLVVDETILSDTITDLCSGGIQKKSAEPPMLCLEPDDALRGCARC